MVNSAVPDTREVWPLQLQTQQAHSGPLDFLVEELNHFFAGGAKLRLTHKPTAAEFSGWRTCTRGCEPKEDSWTWWCALICFKILHRPAGWGSQKDPQPVHYPLLSLCQKRKTTITSLTTEPTCGNHTLPCEVLWGDKTGLTGAVLSLRWLRKIDFDKKLLVSFCQYSSESMSCSVCVWYVSYTAVAKKALQRVFLTAEKIIRCPLPSRKNRTRHILEITCLNCCSQPDTTGLLKQGQTGKKK